MKKVVSLLFVVLILSACGKNAEEYKGELQDVVDRMLENTADAEEIVNSYSDVWRHSIESRGAIPVAEMAETTGLEQDVIQEYFVINPAGNIPDDFSLNVQSLNSYYQESGDLERIKEASDEIQSKINELNNPPAEFEKVYDEVLDMYTYAEQYIEMALNPTGSLQSFNEEKNQLTSEILSKYKRVEAIMPE